MTYTITAVSKTVRDFSGKFGAMKSYKVKLKEFEGGAVEISLKAETPVPKPGDTLEGTVDSSSSFGPQFKKDYTKKTSNFGSRDNPSIKAQFAIKAAVAWLTGGLNSAEAKIEDVEPLARDFYHMVDRVKEDTPVEPENGSEDGFEAEQEDF